MRFKVLMSCYTSHQVFRGALWALLWVLPACASDSLHELPNKPPVAVIDGERTMVTGQEVVFSGQGSSDPDGDTLEYHWDFGGGETARGVEVVHVFAEDGFAPVVLTVTDEEGLSDSTSIEVLVSENLPPEVEIVAPRAALINQPLSIRGSGRDPEGMALTYAWSFGEPDEEVPAADTPLVEKSYAAVGDYTIALTVTDALGASTRVEKTIKLVHNPFAAGQQWVGTYTCPQGLTQLTLHITGVDILGVVGVFDFLHEASGSDGDYGMHGNFNPDTDRIEFFPDSWINQPTGYLEVGMVGTVTEGAESTTFDGDITEAMCGTFSVALQEGSGGD
ncbi:MAG: PKD domain-containing protein [Myxococcota bacterium]|nr:PKD domain-containing protein [Myxococcota bacterium]